LDIKAGSHFERLLKLARETFADVRILLWDITSDRSILKLRARYGEKEVAVSETLTEATQRYSYYLFEQSTVLIGLDNYPDREALRLKYGSAFAQHLTERIPHAHGRDKHEVKLTGEKTFEDFVQMVLEWGGF